MTDACVICGESGLERNIRAYDENDRSKPDSKRKWHYEKRSLCDRCYVVKSRKPSSSVRGRQKDRYVRGPEPLQWIEALRRSWSIAGDCFRCELSALPLDATDSHGPLAISCDHDPPGSDNVLVVAWVINDMKNDHDRDEFYRNLNNLVHIIKDGVPDSTTADQVVADFRNLKHWKRK